MASCLPPSLRRRAVIDILRSGSRGLDCKSFCSSHAPVLTIGSIVELLVGYLGGRFSRHWSSS